MQSLKPEEPGLFFKISKFCYQKLFDDFKYPQVIRDQRNIEKCIRDYGGFFLYICYVSNLSDRFSPGSGTIHSLTHSFQCIISVPPQNIRKPYGFLMFLGCRERVHWERML